MRDKDTTEAPTGASQETTRVDLTDTPAPTELAERWAAWRSTPETLDGFRERCEAHRPPSDDEAEHLFAWLRARADEYRPHAEGHSLDSYAEWLGMDLGGRFEDDRDLTMALLTAAGVRP